MLFDRVAQQYDKMSRQQKKVADHLRAFPQEFIDFSSRDLEARIGVSAATIVRFVQSIGYASLNELRVYVAQQIQHDEEAVELVISPDDDGSSLELKIMQSYKAAAEGLRETLESKQLDRAIELLVKAKRIFILGVGTSGLIAYDLYHRLNRYGKTTFYETDTHMNLEFSTQAKPEDVILAISYSGITKEVLIGAENGHQNGVPVISIVGIQNSPLTKVTDVPLFVPVTENIVRLSSVISRVHSSMVTDILFAGVVKNQLSEVRKSTIATNKLVTELKEIKE